MTSNRRPGAVIFVGVTRGMIVMQHDDGFALIELLGSEGLLAKGDRVEGDWNAAAGGPLYTSHGALDAYFQGSWGTADIPIKMAKGG